MNGWEDLEAPQNVCIASIPTVYNASLAPPGKAVVHAYTAGNEPYSLWEGLDRRGQEYKQLKVWHLVACLPKGCFPRHTACSEHTMCDVDLQSLLSCTETYRQPVWKTALKGIASAHHES